MRGHRKLALALALLALVAWAVSANAAVEERRKLSSTHVHQSPWPGPNSVPHISDKLQRVAVVNPYSFCWEIVFGLTYALGAIAHTVEVYADTEHPGMQGSLQGTSADAVLHTFHNRPVIDIEQLKLAGQTFDLIVYADWYAPETYGPPDLSLRGEISIHALHCSRGS